MSHDPAAPTTPPRRRRGGGDRRRLGVAAAAVAAFAAGSLAGGAAIGSDVLGRGGDAGRQAWAAGDDVLPAAGAGRGDLTAAGSCDDLREEYVARALALVGPWGWDGPMLKASPAVAAESGGADGAARAGAAAEPRMRAAGSSETGTTVQEEGVDEPDVVKTDGRLLLRLDGAELSTWDVTGSDPRRLATLVLPGLEESELLLVGDRAVVLGRGGDGVRPTTDVAVVDVTDPAAPAVVDRTAVDARLVEARRHGAVVRLVTASGLPDLDFVLPGDGRSESTALRENRRLVEETDLADWLPRVPGGDALLACDAVGVPSTDGRPGTLAVTTLLPAEERPAEPVAATGLLTDSDAAYVSRDRLYVATTPAAVCCWRQPSPGPFPGPFPGPLPRPLPGEEPMPIEPDTIEPSLVAPPAVPGDGTTRLHAFALEGARTAYVASGEVDGLVRERWWMDEHDGVLRVAVGPTQATGNFNAVVTLAEEGDRLVELGRVDEIGVNEDIQSVRWFDEMAVLVTFRRIDPLHVVDLTDAASPVLRGELTMPGFSAYLHPIGPDRIIGIGEGPTPFPGTTDRSGRRPAPWGAQAALFDLADLDAPRKVAQHHWEPGSVAGAASDPRQLTWLPEEQLALTVVRRWGRLGSVGEVSVLDFRGGGVAERSVEVEYGADIADVRLVPLPGRDGTRVLLVTGDGVERFDLEG